ncbi:hypothetical protein GCM10025789_01940 [Tessaracoccus lubricantis]|uniref:Secreted protein n=1 Tax=Tessaracoccus lubricantis TaxID=545543 RepID=A0ABP9EXX7_9ACTN
MLGRLRGPFVVSWCSFLAHATLRDRVRPFVVARCFLRLIRSFLANTQDKRKLAHATLRDRPFDGPRSGTGPLGIVFNHA